MAWLPDSVDPVGFIWCLIANVLFDKICNKYTSHMGAEHYQFLLRQKLSNYNNDQ